MAESVLEGVLPGDLMPAQVLVIDDDPRSLKLLELVLRSRGYESCGATNGDDGLSLMRSRRFDLLLLDLMLPGMDGLEVLRQVRIDPQLADLPVVVVSAKVAPTTQQEALDLGVGAYVTKPYRKDELLEVIGALTNPGRGASPGSRTEDSCSAQ